MPADLHPEPQTTDALALIRARLRQGVRASPLCLAVMGWLCDAPTEPGIADIRRTGEGRVWLRLTDEPELAPCGSFTEFLAQVEVICASLLLNEGQTSQIIATVRERLR